MQENVGFLRQSRIRLSHNSLPVTNVGGLRGIGFCFGTDDDVVVVALSMESLKMFFNVDVSLIAGSRVVELLVVSHRANCKTRIATTLRVAKRFVLPIILQTFTPQKSS